MSKKKRTTKNKSLMDNLNRWGKLINQRQIARIKVVYNNSGSKINAAIAKGDFLVTGDLSFFDTDDINEAYYLLAVLNSPVLTQQIKIKKSSRHIFKLPFNTPIKKYNPLNETHKKLVELGKQGEKEVKHIFEDFKAVNKRLSKFRLQKQIKRNIAPILNEIDELVRFDIS
jgi:hypothetical protein